MTQRPTTQRVAPPTSPIAVGKSPASFPNVTRRLMDTFEPLRRSLRLASKQQNSPTTSSHNNPNVVGGGGSGDVDEKDPFTLCQFGPLDVYFTFERKSSSGTMSSSTKRHAAATTIGKVDAASLIDYMLATGDWHDPESRVEFSDADLRRLDILGKRLGKPSVVEAKHSKASTYEAQRFKRDALTGLERMAGVGVSQMYDAIERVNEGKETMEEASVRILTVAVPEIEAAFAEMSTYDLEFARVTKAQFTRFLSGPSQRPTRDVHGMLQFCLEMLDGACHVR